MGGFHEPNHNNGVVMTDITNIVEYYSNLLIIQYHDKPKAKGVIELMVNELLAQGIALDVMNGYDLNTAIGVQLDILGKYIGADRFFQGNDLTDLFALITYAETAFDPNTDPRFDGRWGFVTYANFDSVNEKGVLNYHSVLSKNFQLTDDDYRTLLRLKIIKNFSNGSNNEIDDAIFTFFGTAVTVEETGVMEMTYTVPFTLTALMQAAIAKAVLPKPMGVKLILVEL